MQEQICSEIGLLGDGPAVQQMLDGDYSFPCDTDHYTIRLLDEAPSLYAKTARQVLPEQIYLEDYQYYWRTAREKTQSSKSCFTSVT